MTARRIGRPLVAGLALLLAGCAAGPRPEDAPSAVAAQLDAARQGSVFGPAVAFTGSPLPEVGISGLYEVRMPAQCEVAVLDSGEDSLAARLAMLERARASIRIQALVFKGDESGQRIAEVLKRKKAEGLDVRVIVDAFSNPWLHAQWLMFDLKQHGIEVEGYEALGLQWLNEVPVPGLLPNYDPARPDKRFHEKLWLVDAGTPHAIGVTGGLNIGNEYFRIDPTTPSGYWRDQDVAVRGAVLDDLATAFERNFDYLVGIKRSRGLLDTDRYWAATRRTMQVTGTLPVRLAADPRLVARVNAIAARPPGLRFHRATCRFFHQRPRLRERYIQQAYLKLIAAAREELLVANAYFVATPAIAAALADAAARCVAVTVVSNSPETNDLPEISLVGRGHYPALLAANDRARKAGCSDPRAGIRIREWTGRAPGDPLAQGTLHAKYAVADRRIALVGSYNLDPRSERLNGETALVFDQPALAGHLAGLLLERDLPYTREITPSEAAGFATPADVVQRFRAMIGHLFEDEL